MFSVFSSLFLTSLDDTESDFSGLIIIASVFSLSLQLPSSEPSVNSVAAAVIGGKNFNIMKKE